MIVLLVIILIIIFGIVYAKKQNQGTEKKNVRADSALKTNLEVNSKISKEKEEQEKDKEIILYDIQNLISLDNGWAHYFSYNEERVRYEGRKRGETQSYGDFSISMLSRVELVMGEETRSGYVRAFLDFYTDNGNSRIYITDKKLINENIDFLEEIADTINEEIIPNYEELEFVN